MIKHIYILATGHNFSVGNLIDKYSQRALSDAENLECDIYFIDDIVSVFLINEGTTLTQKLDVSNIYDKNDFNM